jgi:hypothetical protein
LDEKEWDFYENILKVNNNYNFFLDNAINQTLVVIFDYLNNLKGDKKKKYSFSRIIKVE